MNIIKSFINTLIGKIYVFFKTQRGKNILQGLWIGLQYILTFLAISIIQILFKVDFGIFGEAAGLLLPTAKNSVLQYRKHLIEKLKAKI